MVALRQLAAFGLGREWVRHRLATGWLRRMHRGVYLVGPLESPLSRPMAAVLAAGDGAVLSHHSAAALWGLGPPRDEPVHVSVVDRDVRSRAGVRVHRSATHPADITHRHGIRVTAPARTLLDLAPHLTQRDLDRAIEHAQIHHLASTHSLGEQFRRYPKHRGTAALRRATRSDPRLTRSEAERRLLELVRAARSSATAAGMPSSLMRATG